MELMELNQHLRSILNHFSALTTFTSNTDNKADTGTRSHQSSHPSHTFALHTGQ